MSLLCGCFRVKKADDDNNRENQQTTPRGTNKNKVTDKSGVAKAWDSSDPKNTNNPPKQRKVLFLGQEGSGKTTLIHQLIEKKMFLPPPSTTIEQYKITLNDAPMLIVDVPGNTATATREGLLSGLFAIVFVVDWADELRRCLAIDTLRALCAANEHARTVPLLIAVNKVDLVGDIAVVPDSSSQAAPPPSPISIETASQSLGLSMVAHSSMNIICCSPATGVGMQEILLWLSEATDSLRPKRASQFEPFEQAIQW